MNDVLKESQRILFFVIFSIQKFWNRKQNIERGNKEYCEIKELFFVLCKNEE